MSRIIGPLWAASPAGCMFYQAERAAAAAATIAIELQDLEADTQSSPGVLVRVFPHSRLAECPPRELLQQIINDRHELRCQREFAQADGIRNVLERQWGMWVNDKTHTWRGVVGGHHTEGVVDCRPRYGARPRRLGDWWCRDCNIWVFAGKTHCHLCERPAPREDGDHGDRDEDGNTPDNGAAGQGSGGGRSRPSGSGGGVPPAAAVSSGDDRRAGRRGDGARHGVAHGDGEAKDASPAASEEFQRASGGAPLADAEAIAIAMSRDAGEPAAAEQPGVPRGGSVGSALDPTAVASVGAAALGSPPNPGQTPALDAQTLGGFAIPMLCTLAIARGVSLHGRMEKCEIVSKLLAEEGLERSPEARRANLGGGDSGSAIRPGERIDEVEPAVGLPTAGTPGSAESRGSVPEETKNGRSPPFGYPFAADRKALMKDRRRGPGRLR